MSELDDIRTRWAEYNTGAHQIDWYIDRGLALAQDVGVLLAIIERQQAVIDAADEVFNEAKYDPIRRVYRVNGRVFDAMLNTLDAVKPFPSARKSP